MNNVCTLYSSERIEDRLAELVKEYFNNPSIQIDETQDGRVLKFVKKKGLFKGKTTFQISTRFRDPHTELSNDPSALAQNLQGIQGFVSQIASAPPIGVNNLNARIERFASETAILCSETDSKELFRLVETISQEKECVLFCQTSTFVGKGDYPHFLNKDLKLLLDVHGNSDIYPATAPFIEIDQEEETEVFPDQPERKNKSIAFISSLGIKTIDHLPPIQSENQVTIRSSEEIASRAVILAITNLVAFNNLTGEQANEMITQYALGKYVSPDETAFLNDPSDARKNQMTWKCEAVWVLCWALEIIDDIGPAGKLADLNNIKPEDYPVAPGVDPNLFIQNNHKIRSAKEILDQNDLYYRLNWACVDARLNGAELSLVHPGVVYERQYALNWLTNYLDQAWDEVTCET